MSLHVKSEHKLIQDQDFLTLRDLREFVNSFPEDQESFTSRIKISAKIEERGLDPLKRKPCLVLEGKVGS